MLSPCTRQQAQRAGGELTRLSCTRQACLATLGGRCWMHNPHAIAVPCGQQAARAGRAVPALRGLAGAPA